MKGSKGSDGSQLSGNYWSENTGQVSRTSTASPVKQCS
jgi:hypothetical protein